MFERTPSDDAGVVIVSRQAKSRLAHVISALPANIIKGRALVVIIPKQAAKLDSDS
jgi:mRNA-degrading endonuclease toxin of MazEF toxin-antitoxin module